MQITESRSQLGLLPLQHEEYEKAVGLGLLDQRATVLGLRIFEHLTGPADRGQYLFDEESVGDVIGSFLWTKTSRPVPAWRLGAWPTVTIAERTGQDPQAFGVLHPPPGRGRPAFTEAQIEGAEGAVNELSELFLPILNDNFDGDNRFATKKFSKPRLEVLGFLDPNTRTSPRVKIGIDAWPKFPVGWHGVALAADEEVAQNELFLPADPRLVTVNREEADVDAASRIVEIDDENKVDGLRMGRLHQAFRVLRGPATICDSFVTEAKFEDKVDLGMLTWNVHSSGGSDRLPGGLLFGQPSTSTDGTDEVVATLASSRGGPIDLGADIDRHRIGSIDGLAINQAHIAGTALYRFGPRGIYDAPLLHNGIAAVGNAALPEDLERMEGEEGSIIDVFFVFDPTIPHSDFCGRTVTGHHRWFAVIPDSESARPGPRLIDVHPVFLPPTELPPPPEFLNQHDPELGRPPPPPPPPQPPIGPADRVFLPPTAERPPPPPPPMPPDPDSPIGQPRQIPCPAEDSPPTLRPPGPERASIDGPCTGGPMSGAKPQVFDISRMRSLFDDRAPISRAAPIFNVEAALRRGGPQYRAGSLDIFQLLTLQREGHELHPDDRETVSRWRAGVQASFQGAPYGDRHDETFIDTARARGLAHLYFRASWFGDTAPNFAQWTGIGPGGGTQKPNKSSREMRQSLQPIVGRFEAWGNQNDTVLGFDYNDNLHRSRYLALGTSAGGLALLPPETSIDDVRRGVDRSDESQISLLLADRVDMAIGADPEISDGSTRGGWIFRERQATDDLSIMRGKTTAPADADSVFRLDQSDNVLLDLGQGDADAAGGLGVIAIRNRGTAPTTTPANGVVVYSENGELFAVDGDGATTILTGDTRTFTTTTAAFTATLTNADDLLLVDSAARNTDVNLPAIAGTNGKRFTVKKTDSSTFTVTIITPGAELIDGASERVIYNQFDSYTLKSDGSNWHIISEPIQTRSCIVVTQNLTADTATHEVMLVDASSATSGNLTITLPETIADLHGTRFLIKKTDASVNTVTIQGTNQLTAGDNLIEGAFTQVLNFEDEFIELTQDGVAWFITGESRTRSVIGAVPTWHKFSVSEADFTATLTQEDIELFSLVAGGIIHAVKIKHSTAWSGGGATVVVLAVGITGNLDKYAGSHVVNQAVDDETFQLSLSLGSEDHASATSIRVTCAADVAVNGLTAGDADIWVLVSRAA